MKFKLTKGKIIAGAVIIAVLAAALLWGGFGGGSGGSGAAETASMQASVSADAVTSPAASSAGQAVSPSAAAPSPSASAAAAPSPSETPAQATAQQPADDGRSAPAAEQTAQPETKHTCTVEIRCDTILNNMDKLTAGKESLVPSDGCILYVSDFEYSPGDTVFDVLKAATREYGVQMEYTSSSVYNTAYIEGISNLYEFDCGELSGWMYNVDGTYKSVGCSAVTVKDGDHITWAYTCDLGRDL